MPEEELRQTRRELGEMNLDPEVLKLGTFVVDMFLEAGPNPTDRAAATTRCMAALDEMERQLGGEAGSSLRPASRRGCGGPAAVLALLLAVALMSLA